MNRLPTFLMAALLAAATIACKPDDNEVTPMPRLELDKQYTAVNINTGGIYMGIRGRWLAWSTDSASIKPLLTRISTEGKNPGFMPQETTLPASGQMLRFSATEPLAYLVEGGAEKTYRYGVPENVNLLVLQRMDTLELQEHKKPAAADKITYIKPLFYEQTPLPEEDEFDFNIKTLPERYFTIETGELQAPGINYYLKAKDSTEAYASVNNYLNDQNVVLQSLGEGDTLILQVYRTNYK